MESAPKDGTEILLWGSCRPRNSLSRYGTDANVGWWSEHGWQTRVGGEVCDAVFWQPITRPLPSPPEEK